MSFTSWHAGRFPFDLVYETTMKSVWITFGVAAFLLVQASARCFDYSLGGWNVFPPGIGCGCPKTECVSSYPLPYDPCSCPCPCGVPKTTCCTSFPSPCGCPKTTCCTSFPSPCGCPKTTCCTSLPPSLPLDQSYGLPCGFSPYPCGCPVPKTTTCTTIPFGNPICGKTTTCTTYPNPCGKSTTTCTTVPHANPACAKTTTCQTLPLDFPFPCNPCAPLCGKCCSSYALPPGKCGNPLCKCGYCTCPSPCNCGYY